MQYLFSLIFLSLGTFGLVFWTINLLASFLVSYFFIIFGKNLDCWVISDILENISGLTFEYLSAKTVLLIFLATAIFAVFAYFVKLGRKNFTSKKFVIFHSIILLILLAIIFFDSLAMKKVRQNYPPLIIYSSIEKYIKIKKQTEIESFKSLSLNLIGKNKFEHQKNPNKPRTTVFIIGESLRNDYFYSMLEKFSPELKNDKNTLFFKNVNACETSTRKSIPCLLTDVDNKNWQNFLNSVNLIDVFNKVNFKTYWIDNQSLYGYFDSNYSLLAKSSDVVIEQKYINSDTRSYSNYDEVLLPYLEKAISDKNSQKKDKFIIIHLFGSHWHLDSRYPENFAIFNPRCKLGKEASSCSKEELTNSYKNSVVYSLDVLKKILKLLADENALVFFTPDHGFSLGENGKLGNAADGKPFEQISVPMFIWYSNIYKKENQSVVSSLNKNYAKKLGKNLTHEYVFHSLLGCSKIESNLIKKDFNLCQMSNFSKKPK